jgi:diguanylate cyclase
MTPLKVLLIEDSDDDAALIVQTLTDAGYSVLAERVERAETLQEALMNSTFDLAIADFAMSGLSGPRALAIVRDQERDLPFIFVSGTIGEDAAVDAMKQGAHDFIVKGNLSRLASAVERELREAATRRERARANARLTYLAYHDPLTDLPNRSLLHDRLQMALLASKREKTALAVLVLDLDRFKEVNDSLGHQEGDRLLQQVATRLRDTLRESDTVARLGGDEFAILLPLTDLDGAGRAARKVLRDLDQPFLLDGRPFSIRASIGGAGFPAHGTTAHDLLQKADAAMYVAKVKRSGFAAAADATDGRNEQRLALTGSLRQGIDERQFELDYQPILDLRAEQVTGVEALIRWKHPEQGRLMPDDFIRLAEHTGMSVPLTEYSIASALSAWKPRPGERALTIATNLSPHSLHDPALPGRIRETIETGGANASCLLIEITENDIMADPVRSARSLAELHEMGVSIALDDFGTGYSSLSYLRRLPVDALKIDRSFVIDLANGEDDALVRSIIDLAHNLRLRVVAEGVETEDVLDQLRGLGCDAAQGFFIHPPGSAAEIAAWISSQYSRA